MDICNEKLSSTCSERFFGVKVVNKLTLEEHVEELCKKARQKVSAVKRISSLMRFEQRKRIVDLFIISHFSYYPLVWIFHSRRLNKTIDHIHIIPLLLKVVSAIFLLVCFLCLKESTIETRKNTFYFTLKALLVLEIINF